MGGTLSQPNLTKKIQQKQNSQLKYFSIQVQGWQTQMQNTTICKLNIDNNNKNGNSLFAIFDGYRGLQISYFLKQTFQSVLINNESYINGNYQEALLNTFQKIDELLSSQKGQKRQEQIKTQNHLQTKYQNEKISQNSGCTASIILITKKKIIVANIGNVRAFLYRDNVIQLSQLHNLSSVQQKTRIQKASATIIQNRINGNAELSRSFGLFSFKNNKQIRWNQQIITSYPFINTIQRNISDNFIFIGCNGIFEKYQNTSNKFIINQIKNTQTFQNQNYSKCLQNIINNSIASNYNSQSQYGYKNMSAILIKFNQI